MFAMLEDRLKATPFVAGASFSYADIVVGVFVNRWFRMGVGRTSRPAIAAWYKGIEARPGFARVGAVAVT